MAASREFSANEKTPARLEQYSSNDEGRTWTHVQSLTMPGQIPGHLLRLKEGSLLLTYGNRNVGNQGVDGRLSRDEGKSWGAPFRIASTSYADSGYPSTIQFSGGDMLTVYYSKVSEDFHYEMRVARWKLEDVE